MSLKTSKVMYRVGYESQARGLNGFEAALSDADFAKRRERLIAGLDAESITVVDSVLGRLRRVIGRPQGEELDLYTEDEQREFERAKGELEDAIISVRSDLFYWNGCFLPIRQYEPNVFLYRYGLEHLKTLGTIGDRAIIDAGAFVGDSAWIFSPYTRGKVYSFEPLTENFERLETAIGYNGLDNVVPIKAALGEHVGQLKISVGGFTAGASLCNCLVGQTQHGERVQVFKLDDFVAERKIKVGLIKSDVEGAERLLLRGAADVIRRDRPILVVSIYHNADDFFEIKPMIESMNLGYRFKIYHPPIRSISGETLLLAEVPVRSCPAVVAKKPTIREVTFHETLKLLHKAAGGRSKRLGSGCKPMKDLRVGKADEDLAVSIGPLPDIDEKACKRRQAGVCSLSVVIPCYNVKKHVRRCLESILVALCRLNNPAEVICVDDGSTDGTVGEIEKISEEFRLRGFKIAILQQGNRGAGVARNAGLSIAKGKYLHFCDADDWVESDIFVSLIDAAEKSKAEIATCTRRIIRDDLMSTISGFFGPVNDLLKQGSAVISPEDISDSLFSFATQVPWNKIFSRRYINRMKLRFQEIPRANDVYFVCLALVHARRIALVNRPLYNYHINEGSVTRDDSRAGSCGLAFAAVRDHLIEDGLFAQFSDAFALMVFTGYRFYFKMFSSGSGLKRMYPSMRRSLLQLLPDGLGNSGLIHAFYRAEYDIIKRETLPSSLLLQYVRESMHAEAKMSRDRLDLQWQVQDLQTAVNESTAESSAMREKVGELRGYLKRKDVAISAKDASLENLREATGQLRGVVEKQREAITAKDASLENLRGVVEKQREAISAKDAALENLRGAVAQLREDLEKQRKALVAKGAVVKQQAIALQISHEESALKQQSLEQCQKVIRELKGVVEL